MFGEKISSDVNNICTNTQIETTYSMAMLINLLCNRFDLQRLTNHVMQGGKNVAAVTSNRTAIILGHFLLL